MITDECCIAKLRKSTSEPFCDLRIAVKLLKMVEALHFASKHFYRFNKSSYHSEYLVLLTRFLCLVCHLAIFSSDFPRLNTFGGSFQLFDDCFIEFRE